VLISRSPWLGGGDPNFSGLCLDFVRLWAFALMREGQGWEGPLVIEVLYSSFTVPRTDFEDGGFVVCWAKGLYQTLFLEIVSLVEGDKLGVVPCTLTHPVELPSKDGVFAPPRFRPVGMRLS